MKGGTNKQKTIWITKAPSGMCKITAKNPVGSARKVRRFELDAEREGYSRLRPCGPIGAPTFTRKPSLVTDEEKLSPEEMLESKRKASSAL